MKIQYFNCSWPRVRVGRRKRVLNNYYSILFIFNALFSSTNGGDVGQNVHIPLLDESANFDYVQRKKGRSLWKGYQQQVKAYQSPRSIRIIIQRAYFDK